MEAAVHKATVLEQCNCDVESYVASQNSSTISYGLEFRPVAELDALLSNHLHWPTPRQNIVHSINYPPISINEATCVCCLSQALKQGSH
eukprot:2696813-Ditylum_brightwellii.AAC.1